MNFNCSAEEETLTMRDCLYLAIAFVIIPALVSLSIYSGWQGATKTSALEIGVIEPLEKAAHASSIEVAQIELQKATEYVTLTPRLHNLVSGSDSQWQDWYQNLEGQLKNLETIDQNASQPEKTLVLLQTNRVLLQGSEVNLPPDLEAQKDLNFSFFFGCIAFASFCLLLFAISESGNFPIPYLIFWATYFFRKR